MFDIFACLKYNTINQSYCVLIHLQGSVTAAETPVQHTTEPITLVWCYLVLIIHVFELASGASN